jgi:recombinational DNA repair ATPase RecF
MRGYLDAWARYAKEMESRARALENLSQRMEETLTAELNELREELANCAEPRDAQIAELQATVKGLEQYTRDMLADRTRATERLAAVLEIQVSPGTSLQDLIAQAESLIIHTKQQFRESL